MPKQHVAWSTGLAGERWEEYAKVQDGAIREHRDWGEINNCTSVARKLTHHTKQLLRCGRV